MTDSSLKTSGRFKRNAHKGAAFVLTAAGILIAGKATYDVNANLADMGLIPSNVLMAPASTVSGNMFAPHPACADPETGERRNPNEGQPGIVISGPFKPSGS